LDQSLQSELTQSVTRSSGSFELVLGASIFGLLGFLIDRALGLVPLFTIAFAVAALIGATASIYYRYRAAMAELAEQRP